MTARATIDRLMISIHALREESDPRYAARIAGSAKFQSTPSARRATDGSAFDGVLLTISIHALREESDTATTSPLGSQSYFNPRPPRGERRASDS